MVLFRTAHLYKFTWQNQTNFLLLKCEIIRPIGPIGISTYYWNTSKIGLNINIKVLLHLQGVTSNIGFEISFTVILFSIDFLLKLRVKIELTGRERIRPLSILAYLIHATSYVSSFEYTRRQRSRTVQIKNIKLHIVTDIKVTINSLSVFGFRYLVGGRVTTILKKTMSKFSPDLWSYVLYTCMSYKGMYTYMHA